MPSVTTNGKLSVWDAGFIPFIHDNAGYLLPDELTRKFNKTFGHIIADPLTRDQAVLMKQKIRTYMKITTYDLRDPDEVKRRNINTNQPDISQFYKQTTNVDRTAIAAKVAGTNKEAAPVQKQSNSSASTKGCAVSKPAKTDTTHMAAFGDENQLPIQALKTPAKDVTNGKQYATVEDIYDLSDDDDWSVVSDDGDWAFV